MPMYKINVKWGKEKFKDIECNSDEPPELLKAQLFALSGVQPDRQKVMVKGVVIKDDDWGTTKLRDGMTMLMMGSADALPVAPTEKPLFMEDMTEQQLAAVISLPSGLNNLGNTCYMNATLQCLKAVPELKEALQRYPGGLVLGGAMMPDQSITAAVRDLFGTMEKSSTAIPPVIMLNVLHMCFPQFAEKNDQGDFQQQDANECWTELVRCLQRRLPLPGAADTSPDQGAAASRQNGFIDKYFGGEFSITMKCVESEEEKVVESTEMFYQLSCFIEKDVKYLTTGLKSRLAEHVTKNSPSLQRDAQYMKTCKISRLPAYITVQMVRFFYKEKEGVNAKILKDVKFPLSLDLYELCTPALQEKLGPGRKTFKEDEDAEMARKEKLKQSEEGDVVMEEGKKDMVKEPFSFPDDVGSSKSGYYELQAVLTHKGRSSSSGHYVAWVRRKDDEWLMFDDENVTPVTSDDVLKLSGGGDWHCAYVLLYGPRIREVSAEVTAKVTAADDPAAKQPVTMDM